MKTIIVVSILLAAGTAARAQSTTLVDNGDPSKRIDVVFVPELSGPARFDMAIAADRAAFVSACDQAVQVMRDFSPLKECFSFFNIHRVDADPADAPDVDEIVYLLKGSGTSNAYPGGSAWVYLGTPDPNTGAWTGIRYALVHEFGHSSFAALDDEYPGLGTYKGFEPIWSNTSTILQPRERRKWAEWIEPGTPVPTTYDGIPDERWLRIGMFEGAGGDNGGQYGIYRPAYQCQMSDAAAMPFDSVCRQALVSCFYAYAGVSPVDAVYPPPQPIAIPPGRLSISITPSDAPRDRFGAVSLPGYAVGVKWTVDGRLVQQGGWTFAEQDLLQGPPGHVLTVKAEVIVTTDWVRKDVGRHMTETLVWTVTILGRLPRYSTSFQNASDWTLTGLWASDGTPELFQSPWASLNYNNASGTYETGDKTLGSAVSPPIDITRLNDPALSFRCNYQTETYGTHYDKRTVRIRDGTGTLLAEHQLAELWGSPAIGACDAMGTWHTHTLSLRGLSGNPSRIAVELAFDSVDHLYNDYLGWFVDDLVVGERVADFATAAGWTLSGLWEVDGTPATMLGGATASPEKSLNYNNGVNYSTGARTTGTATSPVLSLAGMTRPLLHFLCNYHTETDGLWWDRRYVRFRDGSGNYLNQHLLGGPGMGSAAIGACPAMGVWHAHALDLTTLPGGPSSVKIEFVFDSVDSLYNDHPGWFIDDLVVLDKVSYRTDFASASDWMLDPPVGGVGWAVDGTPAGAPGGAYRSAASSLNYNNGTDYDNGVANSGRAMSPVVSLVGMPNPKLKFWCNWSAEANGLILIGGGLDMGIGRSGDSRIVRLRDGRTGALLPLAEHVLRESDQSLLPPPAIGWCAGAGTWHEHALELSGPGMPSTIQVEFAFDTGDELYNTYPGWFLDDFSIEEP